MFEVTGLSKSFGGLKALENLDISVKSGEVMGLIGPNGSGKTTTINLITGLLKADSGKVQLDGKDLTNKAADIIAKLGTARTFQNLRIFSRQTVRDNIRVAQTTLCKSVFSKYVPFLTDEERVFRLETDALLNEFELSHVSHKRAESLSYGEKKRLEMARALALKPKILLLDEPFAALDVMTIKTHQEIIINLQTNNNISVILCDHQARDLLACVDVAMILSNGKIVAQNTPSVLVRDINAKIAYIGDSFKIN